MKGRFGVVFESFGGRFCSEPATNLQRRYNEGKNAFFERPSGLIKLSVTKTKNEEWLTPNSQFTFHHSQFNISMLHPWFLHG